MKQLHRFISILLLFSLTACGAVIHIRVELPDKPTALPTLTASPTQTSTATRTPTATASPTNTATQSPPTATTLVNLNLRNGACANCPVLTVIPANITIQLFGRSSDSAWLNVQHGAIRGWVSSANNLVRINGASLPSLPIAGQVTPTPSLDPTPTRETSFRLGYNINGLTAMDRTYLLQHVAALCSSQLVMDNLALADEIYQLLDACDSSPPIVVHRSFDSDEGSEWAREPSLENISQWNREGYKHLIRYCTNEPSYGGNQSIEQFVSYHVQLMAQARANGITLACGNFAVGSFRWEDIGAGRYDPFLRAINDYGHYLACHEYTQTVMPFGVSQWPREWLLDRNQVQVSNWPTMAQLPTAMQFDPIERRLNYPRYYHLRRCDWFLLRADQIGIPRPFIILTEYGWDSLADIKPTIEPLRWTYGLNRYMNDLRGVNTYSRLWGWYYPNWSFGRAACEQLKWGDSIYPPEYVAMHLFTWTQHPHWLHTDFSGIENGGMYELHDCLEDYAQN